jgi:hypothetical protein
VCPAKIRAHAQQFTSCYDLALPTAAVVTLATAYSGLRVDVDRVRAENEAKVDAHRKNGLVIWTGRKLLNCSNGSSSSRGSSTTVVQEALNESRTDASGQHASMLCPSDACLMQR